MIGSSRRSVSEKFGGGNDVLCQHKFRSVQFFYVSICVAYFSVFNVFLLLNEKRCMRFTGKIFLRNASFSSMLLCTAKDYLIELFT